MTGVMKKQHLLTATARRSALLVTVALLVACGGAGGPSAGPPTTIAPATAAAPPTAAATVTPAPTAAPATAEPPATALATAPPATAPAQAPTTTARATTAPVAQRCTPTLDDGLSPSYKPNAPERNVVGSGHVVTGVVRSSRDCAPIANAKLEFWPDEGNDTHPDASRATFYSDSEGKYRFECNQPQHIHMRISAEGYRTLASNAYHPEGKPEGTFDIVLVPTN